MQRRVEEAGPRSGKDLLLISTGTIMIDRQLDCLQQVLVADGFGQELHGTGLHGSNRHRDIGVTADEDDRQMNICFDQIFVKIQSASSGQPDIENKASRRVWAGVSQEFLHGAEQFDAQAYRSEEALERRADLLIVIDDDDDGPSLIIRDDHLTPLW